MKNNYLNLFHKQPYFGTLNTATTSMKVSSFCQLALIFVISAILQACTLQGSEEKEASYQKWHPVTLSFEGPQTSESAEDNPFLNYRLNVAFTNGSKTYIVPGFYAADGEAAETGADSGNIWRVHFCPDEEGEWQYTVSFRKGKNIAVSDDPEAGEQLAPDGEKGHFQVGPGDKDGQGLRGKGRLQYVGERYLKFAGTGAYFLKGGTDSPENFLAYYEFDGTYTGSEAEHRSGEAASGEKLHQYQPHAADWREGDPVWQNGKGKNIIGAVNYLASQGMNSIYFLTMNIEGDGKDVWPYTSYEERYRFDCSKLDQWDIVFDHMENSGIIMHLVTQETENETLLDHGDTGIQRKLYYRELIARFAHHLGVIWNMGEENGYAEFTPVAQDLDQRESMIAYMKKHDPYSNTVVLHTHANPKERHEIFEELLGFEYLDGPSLQISPVTQVHEETRHWIKASEEAGKQWVVNLDEIGPANRGVLPDDDDPGHDTVRYEGLWGNLMAGGGGVEWYFGYVFPHNDLNAEDWRSRENMWKQTKAALDFFHEYLPFWEMKAADELINDEEGYCFAKPGEIYAVYLPKGKEVALDLEEHTGTYTVWWFNPRSGGELQNGSVGEINGSGKALLGLPPAETEQDWVALVRRK